MEKARRIVLDLETIGTTDAGAIEMIREGLAEEDVPAKVDSRGKAGRALERAGFLEHYKGLKNKGEWLAENWGSEEIIEARLAEEVESTSTDPMLAEVVVAAWAMDEREVFVSSQAGEQNPPTPLVRGEETPFIRTERELLADLATALGLASDERTVWVGHNLAGFDIPVLINRWRRHGIRAPEFFPTWRWGRARGRIYDTMVECAGRTPFVSADRACAAMGLRRAKSVEWLGSKMDGSRMAEAWAAGEVDLLRRYCAADVEATRELARALTHGFSDLERERLGPVARVRGEELIDIALGADGERERLVGVVEYLEELGVVGAEVREALLG